MALLEIPTSNQIPTYEFGTTLDGTNYILQLYFNPRMNNGAGEWMLSISDKSRNLIVAPVPCVVSEGLFNRFIDLAIPSGTVFTFDTSGNTEDAGQFDLGNRVRLFYLESETIL